MSQLRHEKLGLSGSCKVAEGAQSQPQSSRKTGLQGQGPTRSLPPTLHHPLRRLRSSGYQSLTLQCESAQQVNQKAGTTGRVGSSFHPSAAGWITSQAAAVAARRAAGQGTGDKEQS